MDENNVLPDEDVMLEIKDDNHTSSYHSTNPTELFSTTNREIINNSSYSNSPLNTSSSSSSSPAVYLRSSHPHIATTAATTTATQKLSSSQLQQYLHQCLLENYEETIEHIHEIQNQLETDKKRLAKKLEEIKENESTLSLVHHQLDVSSFVKQNADLKRKIQKV